MQKNQIRLFSVLLGAITVIGMLPLFQSSDVDTLTVDDSDLLNSASAVDSGEDTYFCNADGSIWLSRASDGECYQVLDVEANEFVLSGQYIAYTNTNGQICRYNRTDGHTTSLYEGSLAEGPFSVSEGDLYFLGENTLFSLKDSGEAEPLTEIAGLSDLKMISSDEILLYVENPDYVIEDLAGGEYDFEDNNDQYLVYSYSISSDLLIAYDEHLEEDYVIDIPTETTGSLGISLLSASSVNSSITVNGVSFPFSDYPVDSFFTKNGKSCTCHGQGICVASLSNCNCMRYWPTGISSTCQVDLMASQCMGFARFCQWRAYGYTDAYTTKYYNAFGSKLSAGSWTANTIKSVFTSVGPGGHIRTGSGHSLFVISVSSNGFITYECNKSTTGKNCIIYTRSWTWDTFYSSYGSRDMLYYNMPTNVKPGTVVPGEEMQTGMYQTLASSLNLRSSATTSSTVLTTIPYGTPLSITEIRQNGSTNWGYTTYNGKTGWVSMDYVVYISSNMTSIKITSPPDKTTYRIGDSFSTSGMEVTGYFSDGTSMVIEGYTCSGYNMNKAGTYTVTVSSNGLSTSFTIEVIAKKVYPTSVSLNYSSLVSILGDNYSLVATLSPSDTTERGLTWTSSNSDVASVSSSGALTIGKKAGTATITVTTDNGLKASVTITAIAMPTGTEWSVTADGSPLPALPSGIDAQDYSIRYQTLRSDGSWSDWIYGDVTAVQNQTTRCQFRSFTVSFLSEGKEVYPTQAVDVHTVIKLSDYQLEREGYLFAGWFTTNQAALSLDSSKAYGSTITVSGDVTCYAGWISLSGISSDSSDPFGQTTFSSFGMAGSSLKVDEESVGIRFCTRLSTSVIADLKKLNGDNGEPASGSKGIGYGTVVILRSALSGNLVKGSNSDSYLSTKKAVTVPAENVLGSYNGYILYDALVTGYSAAYYSSDFVARAYITYKDVNGFTHTYYDTVQGSQAVGGGLADNLQSVAETAYETADLQTKQLIEDLIFTPYGQ